MHLHGQSMFGLPRLDLFGVSRSEVSFSLSLSSHGESNKDRRALSGCGFVPRKTWLWYLKIWGKTESHGLSMFIITFPVELAFELILVDSAFSGRLWHQHE